MSNNITQLKLFKRYTYIQKIQDEIERRNQIKSRIDAHNKKVASDRTNGKKNTNANKASKIINKTVINNSVNIF
jgi:hypothetical protein